MPMHRTIIRTALPPAVTVSATTDGGYLDMTIVGWGGDDAEDRATGALVALYACLGEQLPDEVIEGE